jgi:DNA-binding XRE family transcriptional regulator
MAYPQVSIEEMKIRREFGARLMSAREEARLTRVDLAELIDLNKDYIYRVENGMRNPIRPEYEKYKEVFLKGDDYFYPNGIPKLAEELDKARSEARKKGEENKKRMDKSIPVAPDINTVKNKIEDVQEVLPMEQVKFVESKNEEAEKINRDKEKREEAFLGEIRQVKKEYEDIIAKINKQFQVNFDSMKEEYSKAIEKLREENEKLRSESMERSTINGEDKKELVPVVDAVKGGEDSKALAKVDSNSNKKMSLSIPFTEGRNIVLTIEEAI